MKDLLKCHLVNYCMILSPCKNYLAISNNFNSIKIINLISDNESETYFLNASDTSNGNIFHLQNCKELLICSSDCYIVAWKWNDIKKNLFNGISPTKYLWKESLPINSDYLGYLQVLSMVVNEKEMLIYVGSSDGIIHTWRVLNNESPRYLSNMSHLNTVPVSMSNGKGFSLITGCTDGSILFWDNRQKDRTCLKFDTNISETSRPKLGTSINVVNTDEDSSDWILCGGEPKLGLWNIRAAKIGVVFDNDSVIYNALLRKHEILAGGASNNLSLWDMSGELNSEIILNSLNNIYDILYREKTKESQTSEKFKEFFVCGWGSSVELYSNVGYRKKSYEC